MQYPKQWEFLKNKFEAGPTAGGLAHAYLFSGQDEAGVKSFVQEFVALVCGLKKGVTQYIDLLVVKSENSDSSLKNEKDMMEIDIDQIRAVQQFLSYKSYYGGYKIVIIENAQRMNAQAQNCFLKSLEEPKGKTLIILQSANPEFLLPTIFSRC